MKFTTREVPSVMNAQRRHALEAGLRIKKGLCRRDSI